MIADFYPGAVASVVVGFGKRLLGGFEESEVKKYRFFKEDPVEIKPSKRKNLPKTKGRKTLWAKKWKVFLGES